MNRIIKLRMTGQQHAALYNHLYPGDGKEAGALAICGMGRCCNNDVEQISVSIDKIVPINYDKCSVRTVNRLDWNTDILPEILKLAESREQVILKIHSHPTGLSEFSSFDDESDRILFQSIAGWLDTDFPGVSAIMLPDKKVLARAIDSQGKFEEIYSVMIVDSDIDIWFPVIKESENKLPRYSLRTVQTFGQGTTRLLSKLCVGVIGVSGTGSPTIEMLYRLGIGKLVICDGDKVEDINVGRIYNSTIADAQAGRFKVDVMTEAIKKSGLPTEVISLPCDALNEYAVRQMSQCDILFGCVDSVEARELLNRICVYYSIPFFDLGVKLEADGKGGVDQVCGTVHYIKPDGSSLLNRRVYTQDDLASASLKRTDIKVYEDQIKSKYIHGIQEDSPAVISVNTLVASLAVNDFLARLHQYRDEDNAEVTTLRISLTQTRYFTENHNKPCEYYSRYVGRGDCRPLLNMPYLD